MASGLENLSVDELRAKMERVGEVLMPFIEQMSSELQLSFDDTARLFVVAYGREMDASDTKDQITLVISGKIAAYDSATQVIAAGLPKDW